MAVFKLSPSAIGLFLDCPRCFWLDRNGTKRPDGMFPSLPGGMDRVLKEHFDRFRSRDMLPPELEKAGFKGSLFRNQPLLDDWRNRFRGLSADMPEINSVVRGAIDDLLVDEDGETLIPFDFKTKGTAPADGYEGHYHHQMCIYGFMLEKMGHPVGRKAYLMFYHPDAVKEDGSVLFGASLVEMKIDPEDAEILIRRAAKALDGEEPEGKQGCKYCELRGK